MCGSSSLCNCFASLSVLYVAAAQGEGEAGRGVMLLRAAPVKPKILETNVRACACWLTLSFEPKPIALMSRPCPSRTLAHLILRCIHLLLLRVPSTHMRTPSTSTQWSTSRVPLP